MRVIFNALLPRTPRVSIIIPTKNQQPMLQHCLVTLLQTTHYPGVRFGWPST